MTSSDITRRLFVGGSMAALTCASTRALGFGDEGAFNPRILLTGTSKWEGQRKSAPARLEWRLT